MISQLSICRGRISLLIAFITLGTLTMQSCQPSNITYPTPDVKGPTVSSGPISTDIPIYECISIKGVELTATSPSPGMAKIEISGLTPYESIKITIRAEGADWSQKVDIWSITADAYGTYATTEGVRAQGKESPIEWKVQVIHARGVACATVEVINP